MNAKQIISSSAGLFHKPDLTSGRETDALFGETVDVLNRDGDWAEIILTTDGYQAWIEEKHLGQCPEPTHHIMAPRALMTTAADIKSPAAGYLPMGSLAALGPLNGRFRPVLTHANETMGYILDDHVLPLGEYVDDFVTSAERLIGTPYSWGGRDSFGFDCSALVQLSLGAAGIQVKRNSGDQEKTIGVSLDHLDELKRGDLVFWKGHVGIMQDRDNLLHANMWHGMTASENLRKAIPRLEEATGPITRLARVQ